MAKWVSEATTYKKDKGLTNRSGARVHIHATAYHEAGHAVAAIWEQRELVKVEVWHDRPGNGLTTYGSPSRNPYDAVLNSGCARAAWEYTLANRLSDIRIALAGPLAEAKALNTPLRALGAYSDLNGTERKAWALTACWEALVEFTNLPPLNATLLINQQRAYMRSWVGKRRIWGHIGRIATVLTQRELLRGVDVYRELAEAERPAQQLGLALDIPADASNTGTDFPDAADR